MAVEGRDVRGPVFITKYQGRVCDIANCLPGFFPTDLEPRTTEIRNLRSTTIDVNAPIEQYSIPETNCCQAIIIKVYGNHTTISIQWVIHDETSNIVGQTLDVCCCASETDISHTLP